MPIPDTFNTGLTEEQISKAFETALNTYTSSDIDSLILAESDAREAADEETTAALAELVDSGAKNLYSLSGKSTTTNNGITFAVDGTEGSITMTGTASNGDAVFTLLTSMDIGEGFVMSGWGSVDGAKDGWFMDSYSTGYTDRKIFYTSAKTVSDTFVWRLIVKNGATMDGVVFKPMLCTKAAWGISQKHVPYRPCYQELYDRILALENQQ